jgi:flagellar basal body P-ring protein FlgI
VFGEMAFIKGKTIYLISFLQLICCISSCQPTQMAQQTPNLGSTIGSLVEVVYPESISVEGYGLVGGLRGTGSMECPPQVRTYLTQYIMAQLSDDAISKAEGLINSPNTAVVLIQAVIPIQGAESEYFDIMVTALTGTQTTSLEGGWLFPSEMKIAGSFGITTEILADAQGPIFMNKIGTSGTVDKRTGYILAGGKDLTDYKVILVLRKPDFELTNIIRNRLNEHFGRDIARAVLPGRIEIKIPSGYNYDRRRFISLAKAMYLDETPEDTRKRINYHIEQLTLSPDSPEGEIALEAIGNQSLADLYGLLNSTDEHVRLRAARCMLNLGSNASLETLRRIALDRNSDYRLEALEAITSSNMRQTAVTVARELLNDEDFNIRVFAYEQLRKLGDVSIAGEPVDKNFFLEQIVRSDQKTIYVTRSGQPRIVLFGAPIYCNRNIFVESPDKQITVNAPGGQEYVSIIRAHPKREGIVAQMKSSFSISDIIRTLCTEPLTEGQEGRGGLGVTYAETIAFLKQMCDKGAVNAEFRAGPMPKIGLNVKK